MNRVHVGFLMVASLLFVGCQSQFKPVVIPDWNDSIEVLQAEGVEALAGTLDPMAFQDRADTFAELVAAIDAETIQLLQAGSDIGAEIETLQQFTTSLQNEGRDIDSTTFIAQFLTYRQISEAARAAELARQRGSAVAEQRAAEKNARKIIHMRRDYIEKFTVQYMVIAANAETSLVALRDRADLYSHRRLAIGGVGILAGVASAALVVASPANAMWVAGLSATATGAVSQQTQAALEGFSRDAVASVYNDLRSDLQTAATETSTKIGKMESVASSDEPTWNEHAGAARSSLLDFHVKSRLEKLPMGGRAAELEKRVEQLQKELQKERDSNKPPAKISGDNAGNEGAESA